MPSLRLGPTSYLVLGLVALRGPSTPYELERAVSRSVGYFWHFPHAQLYAEPARLTGAGLLSEAREEAGRRRRTYSITAAGRDALRAWLRRPADEPMEIRDLGELQLFFSELVGEEEIVLLARAQADAYRRRFVELEAIEARFGADPTRARRMASLRLGMAVYRAAIDFWEQIEVEPPGAT